MLARIHRSMREKDEGFTLIELLVVMIIIGILAAIAIPVFLSQRAKAQDTATKADVTAIGKEVATYYVDNTQAPTVSVSGTAPNRKYTLTIPGGAGTTSDIARVSSDTIDGSVGGNLGTATTTSANWCVSLNNTAGSEKVWNYSAAGGLQKGACA